MGRRNEQEHQSGQTYAPKHMAPAPDAARDAHAGSDMQAAGRPAHARPVPKRRRRARSHAFRLNVRRAITDNLARFFAVFGIVAIGAGVYAGLRMFVPDMYASADAFFDRYNFADIQVSSPLGLTDDDVEAVRQVEGVRGATGVASYEMSMADGAGATYEVQVEALDMELYASVLGEGDGRDGDQSAVSRLVLREGRLPESPDEIVMSTNGQLKEDDVQVGDVLSVNEVVGADEVGDVLAQREFTVVGLVQSPEWLSNSTGLSPTSGARITNYAYVDLDAMADPGLYTSVIATTDAAIDEVSFTDAYAEAVEPVRDALKRAAPAREQARYDELAAELDDARAELKNALQQATDAQARAQAGVDAAQAAVAQWQPVVDELAAYDADTLAYLGQTENLAAAQAALAQANDALATAQDGLAQATDAAAQATDALAQVDETAAELEPQHWYVLDRNANPSCYLYQATALRMERICLIFPIFFFLVAALVSLTTMSRMVETDRVEIGTLKALGYTKNRIGLKYLAFSGLASALGAAVGIVAGVLTLPRAIWTPYSRIYIDFAFLAGFHQPDCLIALGLSVALSLGATWFAVRRTLRESAASLLLPARPKGGRRILLERVRPLWRRISFSHKVTARNLFRYKKRMVMTVVGVAGCTGLVLTGFGVQDKLDGFVQAQYGGVYTYDVVVNFDADADAAAGRGAGADESQLASLLDAELGAGQWTYVAKQAAVAENPGGDPARIAYGIGGRMDQTGGSTQAEMRDARSDSTGADEEGILRDVFLFTMRDGSGQGLINIDDYRTGERLELPDEGCVVTERLAEQLLAGVGDTIELAFDTEDDPVEVEISGIMHNYVGHYVYLSPQAYEAAFGEEPAYNMAVGWNSRGTDEGELVTRLAEGSPAVVSASLPSDEAGGYEDIASSLDSIVVILLVVSGMLAFIVIYALTEINLEERRREIATLKVLGFMRPEVRGYVYRETYLLVGIGILCGLPFGVWLCDFIMRAAEFDNVIYFRTIDAPCFAFAVLFTAAVAALVTLAMRRRLYAIDMVASLKSVD